MLRVLMAIVAVVALAVPAAAYDRQFDGDPAGDITIYLTLDCYIQILWQDIDIVFDGTNDWWSPTLEEVAYQGPGGDDQGKTSIDPWAGDSYYGTRYFESGDAGYVYVKSNNVLSLNVHSMGDLASTEPPCPECEIPTWFTMALSGPFYVEGADIGIANIPFDGWGTYVHEDPPGTLVYGVMGEDNFPYQYCFRMHPESQDWLLGPLCPYVEGNILFHARIERNGLADAGGAYQTMLNLTFSTP